MEPRCSQGGRRGTPRKTETAPQVAPMPPHTLPATWRGCNWGAMGCNWGAILPGAIPCCLPGRREAEGERETHSQAPRRLKQPSQVAPMPPTRCLRPGEGAIGAIKT